VFNYWRDIIIILEIVSIIRGMLSYKPCGVIVDIADEFATSEVNQHCR